MRSHFLPAPGVAATACLVAGASLMMNGKCPAQPYVAADYATNSTYAGGWTAGQNGGYGFGPWSFDSTDMTPPGQYQGISTASALGTAWTLLTLANHSGLANCGRAILEPGGLQPGQTLETVIQNPSGNYFYRGWDILCLNATDNNPGGDNVAGLRTQVFAYFVTPWSIQDEGGSTTTPLNSTTTATAGMKFDFTLTSTNAYSVTLTPLSDVTSAYTQTGTIASTNLPINWVNFRLYWDTSSGLNDPTDNFEISSMTISAGVPLYIQQAGTNVVLSWPGYGSSFTLLSSPALGNAAVWTPVSTTPTLINGQNVVTNGIGPGAQFFKLEL